MDAIIIWLIQTTNTNTGDGGGAALRGSPEEGESISPFHPRQFPLSSAIRVSAPFHLCLFSFPIRHLNPPFSGAKLNTWRWRLHKGGGAAETPLCGTLFAVPNSLDDGCASSVLLLLPVCLLGLDAAAAFSTPFCVSIIDNSFSEEERERERAVHSSPAKNTRSQQRPRQRQLPRHSQSHPLSGGVQKPKLPSPLSPISSPLLAALKLGPF